MIFTACSSVPKNTKIVVRFLKKDICGINMLSLRMKKWGAPIHLQLAFIKGKSDFNWLAKPPRENYLKLYPFKRPSTSFGYSQAVEGTWKQYKKETDNPLATRARFKDSVDFIGWYINKTSKILKISKKDPYRQYLAYYKGCEIIKIIQKIKKQLFTLSQ